MFSKVSKANKAQADQPKTNKKSNTTNYPTLYFYISTFFNAMHLQILKETHLKKEE